MPTTTFENLPEEKKSRITEAAIDEFAQYRFTDASINRIVKAAAIPRGSFYQYFENKEDLYIMIMDKIRREKFEIYAAHPAPSENSTFFDAAIASIPAVLEWIERYPKYDKIAMLMSRDDLNFMSQVIGHISSNDNGILDLLEKDKKRGLIRSDVDLNTIVEIIMPAVMSILREYYSRGEPMQSIEKMKSLFDIIGNGIFSKEADTK